MLRCVMISRVIALLRFHFISKRCELNLFNCVIVMAWNVIYETELEAFDDQF